MAKSPKNTNTIPSVLAFEKKLVPSDGYLYGTSWDNRHQSASALTINTKSVRGTISNRLKSTVTNDPLKMNAEVQKPNLQEIDACALTPREDTLKLHFTLKILSGLDKPTACNNAAFLETYREVLAQYIETYGFQTLAQRYALNIANSRFLWRNRVGAEKLEVVVSIQNGSTLTFNPYDYSLNDFDRIDEKINTLANEIAVTLCGQKPYLQLTIDAYALLGEAQEVYPSQELFFSSDKISKSKVLYQVDGIAAMHSQKLGNALRTIDTWYPDFEDVPTGPIAIEPYGAVTSLGIAYRSKNHNFYDLFDRYALGETLSSDTDKHYVMAVLVRGGVFGNSGKDQ